MSEYISEKVTPTTDVRIIQVKTIENSLYRPYDAYNQSFIKLVNEHGLNMANKLVSEREEPTDDMLIGSVFHAILSGDESAYMRVPKFDRRTKDGKAAYESMMSLAHENGKTMVQEHLWDKAASLVEGANGVVDQAVEMRNFVEAREESMVGIAEVFRDDQLLFSLPIKGQIDHYMKNEDRALLIDYKTAPSSTYEAVRRKARDSHWPLQAFVYSQLMRATMGMPEIMYVVSGKDTGASRAYTFSTESLDVGRAEFIKGLIRIHNQKSNPLVSDDTYFGVSVL
jgi:ATP-dependent exoDNAse (exonuclease V) beta subunit